MRKAAIYYDKLLAGTLTETDDGEYVFIYGLDYVKNNQTQFITFTMPVTEKPYKDKR